jgi:Uma2 family endonuclease
MLDLEFPTAETREKEMPSLNHSYLCTQIMRQLLQDPAILPLTELTLNVDNGLTPDISVYPSEKINPDFFNDIAKFNELPTVAIEIVSPSQNIQVILDKARKLADAGVPAVLALEPYGRTVFLTRKDAEIQILKNQTVEVEGISIDFQRIFQKQH